MRNNPAVIMSELLHDLGVAEVAAPTVVRRGRTVELSYRVHPRTGRAMLQLATVVDSVGATTTDECARAGARPCVRLRRQTGRDRLGKRLALNRELHTGDDAFDAAVYVESDSPDADVASMLGSAAVRAHVSALVAAGSEVELDERGLTASMPMQRRLGRFAVETTADELTSLAAALPLYTSFPPRQRRKPIAVLTAVALIVPCFLLLALQARHGPIRARPQLTCLGVGVAVLVVVALVLARAMRGRSDSLRHYAVTLMMLTMSLPFGVMGVLFWVNHAFDHGPRTAHATKVDQVWARRKGTQLFWAASAADWCGHGAFTLEGMPSPVAERLRVAQPITITTGAGRLGWEWLADYEIRHSRF